MIELTKDDGLWIVTINRPDKANSLTSAMLTELSEIAEAARSEARAFILTGTGKVFSAGADLDEVKSGVLAKSDLWGRLSSAIAALPCMTVAALNGTLAGGANGMALACDLRIAVPGSSFFYPVMRLGFLPQEADVPRMTALIGPARTKLILMGGQKISTQEAYDYGLIDRIVDPNALMETAKDLVSYSVKAPVENVAKIKEMCDG